MNLRRGCWVVFIGVLCGLVVIVIEWNTLPYWHAQTRNLIKVGQWTDRVSPAVSDFAASEGLQIRLFGFTGAGGTVGVRITTTTQEQFLRTRTFLHSLNPPRNIEWIFTIESTSHTKTLMDRLGPNGTTTETIREILEDAS